MNNLDERFLVLFAVGLLIFLIVMIFEYFKKIKVEKEHKEFLEWLKSDNFNLYQSYINKQMSTRDNFALIAGKILFLDEKKKGK